MAITEEQKKAKRAIYNKEYQARHREAVLLQRTGYRRCHRKESADYDKKRYEAAIAFVNEYKRSRGCTICREKDPICLDFHHLDPKDKDFGISVGAWNGMTFENLLIEMDKCMVLCKNCHAKLHRNEKLEREA
jgi:hypothetical protein